MSESDLEHPVETKEKLDLSKQIVVLIGPEGSGKTIISKRLAQVSGLPRVALGEIFRKLAIDDTGPWGDECRASEAQERYVSPKIVLAVMEDRFRQDDLSEGFIMDGAMRSVEEVEGFQETLDNAKRSMPVTIISFRAPGWLGVERISNSKNRANRDNSPRKTLSNLSQYYKDLGKRTSLIRSHKDWKFIQVDAAGDSDTLSEKVQTALTE